MIFITIRIFIIRRFFRYYFFREFFVGWHKKLFFDEEKEKGIVIFSDPAI